MHYREQKERFAWESQLSIFVAGCTLLSQCLPHFITEHSPEEVRSRKYLRFCQTLRTRTDLRRDFVVTGQRVDTSMLAVTANLMESPISRHSYCGEDFLPKPEGLAHPVVAPFDGFRTADGTLYIATSNDARCVSPRWFSYASSPRLPFCLLCSVLLLFCLSCPALPCLTLPYPALPFPGCLVLSLFSYVLD